MGQIAIVLDFTHSNEGVNCSYVKSDSGGGINLTSENFQPSGEDSTPLPGDYVIIIPVKGTGRTSAIGYIDLNTKPCAKPGEKRIYARNEEGEVVNEIRLFNTSKVVIKNDSASITLNPNGNIEIESKKLKIIGDVKVEGGIEAKSITADSINGGRVELVGHTHTIVPPNSALTGPPS